MNDIVHVWFHIRELILSPELVLNKFSHVWFHIREQVCPNVAFPWYVVHLKAIEIIDKGLYDMIVSKQHYLLGMILV